MKCDFALKEEYRFAKIENSPDVPALDILIFHDNFKNSISTLAIIDTGFDEALLLSKILRDAVYKFVDPYAHGNLYAGSIEIPCELYALKIRIADRWLDAIAYAPIIGDYDNLIGRKILNDFNLCLRAPSRKVYLSEK